MTWAGTNFLLSTEDKEPHVLCFYCCYSAATLIVLPSHAIKKHISRDLKKKWGFIPSGEVISCCWVGGARRFTGTYFKCLEVHGEPYDH